VKIPPAQPGQERQGKNYEEEFSQADESGYAGQKRVSKLCGIDAAFEPIKYFPEAPMTPVALGKRPDTVLAQLFHYLLQDLGARPHRRCRQRC
jgi:hypothetical protein